MNDALRTLKMSSAISFIFDRLMDTCQFAGLAPSSDPDSAHSLVSIPEEVRIGWVSTSAELSMLPHLHAIYF